MTAIAGKNVLITGGAGGIGRLIALDLARRGARVVVWDLDGERLGRVVEELRLAGTAEPRGDRCDVSSREEVYRAAGAVLEEVGPIDVLINNAGVVSGRRFLELPDEKIVKTFGVNTLALFWTAKAFLPDMIERDSGHVVTVASAAGTVGVARLADYCASKFAAVGFDESLRAELRQVAPGVRTTVVCPYYIDTGMFDGVKTRFPRLLPILKEQEVARRIVKAILEDQRRLIMPPAVALLPALRLLPVGVFDAAASFLGVSASMDEFHGHSGRAS